MDSMREIPFMVAAHSLLTVDGYTPHAEEGWATDWLAENNGPQMMIHRNPIEASETIPTIQTNIMEGKPKLNVLWKTFYAIEQKIQSTRKAIGRGRGVIAEKSIVVDPFGGGYYITKGTKGMAQ